MQPHKTEYQSYIAWTVITSRLTEVFHCLDGPAVEHANGSKTWFIKGYRHRVDGPACEWSTGLRDWCICQTYLKPWEYKSALTLMSYFKVKHG